MAILIFMLVAVVCITMFVRAHLLSVDARHLNRAINMCDNTSEMIRIADTMDEAENAIGAIYDQTSIEERENGCLMTVGFDDNYNCVTEDKATGIMEVDMSLNDGLITSVITYFDENGEIVYSLTILHGQTPWKQAASSEQ